MTYPKVPSWQTLELPNTTSCLLAPQRHGDIHPQTLLCGPSGKLLPGGHRGRTGRYKVTQRQKVQWQGTQTLPWVSGESIFLWLGTQEPKAVSHPHKPGSEGCGGDHRPYSPLMGCLGHGRGLLINLKPTRLHGLGMPRLWRLKLESPPNRRIRGHSWLQIKF